MELGKLREHIPLYSDTTGSEMGSVDIYENGVKILADGQSFIAPPEYVQSITPERDLALGKVQAHMVFYELMGMRHELRFIISGVQLATLQSICGKK